MQVFYFFGVKESIKKLFAKPEWCALRGTGRDTSAAGFYGSREAQRLHDETGGRFSAPSSSAYELGFDYGQIFNFKTHSTGIMVLRCAALYTLLSQNPARINEMGQQSGLLRGKVLI